MATEVIIDAMPFDSREVTDPETGDVYYDRIHSAEDFAQWLSTFFGNGIVVAGSNSRTRSYCDKRQDWMG